MDGSSSRGAHLQLPGGDQLPSNSWSDPCLVVGVSGAIREKVGFVQCFGDFNYTYGFGHDPTASTITVDYYSLLTSGSEYGGGGGGAKTNVVTRFAMAYKSSRVSQSKEYARVTLGGSSNVFSGFVVGMATSTNNPEYNIQGISLTLALAECQPA